MTTPDPLAEVARLRDPAGPWLHLLWGAPADARQFGWLLAGEGLVARVLRGPCVRTAFGLYDEAAAALQFPGDLVEDWPAFASLLGDLSWLPGPGAVAAGHVLVVTRASLLLAAAPRSELASFVASVVAVAGGRAAERGPALHVVLADEAVGLAALRARLTAVRASVRDVVAWRPEEPTMARGVGGRTSFRPGPAVPDEVDAAVAAALPEEVVELRRGWEEYHGPAVDPVRTYGVVLRRPELAVAAAGLVAGVAGGREEGACVVQPVHADPARRGEREAAFVAASVVVWPLPAAPAQSAPEPARPASSDAPVLTEDPVSGEAPAATPAPATPAPDAPPGDRVPTGGGPRDEPGAPFALVAADLEWEFAQGAAEHDPVDAALVELARDGGQFEAVFRTWTRDPAAGWVRVLVGYAAGRADPARAALVSTAQAAGAGRTCVEVVAQADVGDVHRWLERQCVTLWRTEPGARSVQRPSQAPKPPAPPTSDLDPDTEFRKGPDEPDEAAERLIAWAATRPGVLGLVAARTGPQDAPELVYGIVVDGDTEHAPVRAEAGAALGDAGGPVRIESFAPSRGLSPLYLRLYRGSTRLWTQRADRPARGAAAIDSGPKIDLTFEDVIERVEIEDETLDGGFTLVALTQTEPVTEPVAGQPPEPDGCDRAVVEWAAEHPNLLAAVRAEVTVHARPTRVYLLAADPDADVPAVRRAAGAIMAARGLTRGGVEVFCPLDPIPRFHLDLFKHGAQLWRSERKLTRPEPSERPPEQTSSRHRTLPDWPPLKRPAPGSQDE